MCYLCCQMILLSLLSLMNPLIFRDDICIKAVLTASGTLRGVSIIRLSDNENLITIIAQPCSHLEEQVARFLSLTTDEHATLHQFLAQFCEPE